MKKSLLYSIKDVEETYKQVQDLLITKYIIKTYSTNREDIRDVALAGLELSHAKKVLELGCGYGFFIEKLKGKLHNDASIIGIDLVSNNRDAYLNTVACLGYRGEFINENVELIKKIEDSRFDLIISSYSLYFFPYLIDEIARLLKPDGLFIALTHSKHSLHEIISLIPQFMKEIGLKPPKETALTKLFMSFSLEDGDKQLEPYFKNVEKIVFKNSILFTLDDIDDCIYYIEKKRNLIYKEILDTNPDKVIDLESYLSKYVYDYVKNNKHISLNKDDAVFRCYKPKINKKK